MKPFLLLLLILSGLQPLQGAAAVASVAPQNPFDLRRLEHGPAPDLRQQGEQLQHYAVSQLRMVGTLGRPGKLLGLIIDPLQQIHLLGTGAKLGPTQVVVEQVDLKGMTLREYRPRAKGPATERVLRLNVETGK
jgi:Tfp pilus assembly protein PilP